jgi:two-component system, sensor histidine kinase YesM
LKRQSFKYSLLGFISLMMMLMIFINIYSMLVIKSIETQYSTMIEKMLSINEIGNEIDLSVFYFDKYFSTKSPQDLEGYKENYLLAVKKLKPFKNVIDEETQTNLKDLSNVINNYHLNGEKAIKKYEVMGRSEEVFGLFNDTKQIADYCKEYIKRLNNSYLKYNDIVYKNLKEKTSANRVIITMFTLFTTLFSIVFSAVFSRMITIPIGELAQSAEEIARGNFEIQRMNPAGMYEIDALRAGFNKMVAEIKLLIEKMKEKAVIEKKLDEQEMKNLIVENMLRESQLKTLQSQINPHFLFNTLNAISQTSIFEEAYETEKLINAVSELLRYSLNMIDRLSKVEAEISIIKQYVYIQETRFKDRVKFNIIIDKSLNDVQIPGMILQPLVENAFMHGIESLEEGGVINVTVHRSLDLENYCLIKVEDNGIGITDEKLESILNNNENDTGKQRAGIGVKNVIKRLRLMYVNQDVFRIESTIGKGTTVYIKIPIIRGCENV